MFILGWMTIRNIRETRHIRQETMMLTIQVSILSMAISIQKMYSEMTLYQMKTTEL
jgi:hypothetical protein